MEFCAAYSTLVCGVQNSVRTLERAAGTGRHINVDATLSIRLLPRVFDGEAPVRPWMKDARRGKPFGNQLRRPRHVKPSFWLAAEACVARGRPRNAGTLRAV